MAKGHQVHKVQLCQNYAADVYRGTSEQRTHWEQGLRQL